MAEAMVARAPSGLDWGMSDVLPRAGVTSAVFHEAFPDRESCLLATFELGVERARRRMLEAYDVERRWLDAIRAGIAALLRFLEDEPALGRVLVVYSLGGGERVLRRRVRVMAALAAIVDRGRLEGQGTPAADSDGDRRGGRRCGPRDHPESPAGGGAGRRARAVRIAGQHRRAPVSGRGSRTARADSPDARRQALSRERPERRAEHARAGLGRHAAHLPHGARPARDRGDPRRQQPRGRRSRGHH